MLPKWTIADIQQRMFNRPLMVTRERAEIALGVLGPRMHIGALLVGADAAQPIDRLQAKAKAARAEVEAMPGDDDMRKYRYMGDGMYAETTPYELWNGVAILQVRGTLMAENGCDPMSGATGYDGLSFKARTALADPNVKGGLLDIDSGGGEVVDLLELCSQLRAFAKEKPLRAIIRGNGCSAAYALAACAGPGQITGAPYSVVGSIGAIMMHADWSKNLEQDGIDVTLITSAAHKADATSVAPLDPGVAAKLKVMVDDCAASFIDHVASSREVDRDGIVAQQAAFFSGQDALRLGLIDKFMSWDDSMREFAQIVNTPAPAGHRSTKGTSMSGNAPAPAAEGQPEFTKAQMETATATSFGEGKAKGVEEGAKAEQARFAALAELDGASTVSAALSEAISAGTSVADFALAQARAGKAKIAGAAEAAKTEAVAAGALPAGGANATPGAQAPVNRGQAYAAAKAARKQA